MIRSLYGASVISAAVLVAFCWTSTLSARFLTPDLKQVPIENLINNLKKHLEANPNDSQAHMNLGRIYAMAYVSGQEKIEVNERNADQAWFGYTPRNLPFVHFKRQPKPKTDKKSKELLDQAIKHFTKSIELDDANLVAKLSLAWTYDHRGNEMEALTRYREVVAAAWEKEKDKKTASLNFQSITDEAITYLMQLLNMEKDADELADLNSKLNTVRRISRPVTPIAIPLGKKTDFANVVALDASVWFDADGSGIDKSWSWIQPSAGWLVYDQVGEGKIESALQMFGNVTFWCFWDHGYQPLAALDANQDGKLSGHELNHLAIWQDSNSNGISDNGEVLPLMEHGIREIQCSSETLEAHPDRIQYQPQGIVMADGSTRPSYDVLLHPTSNISAPVNPQPLSREHPTYIDRDAKRILFISGRPSHGYGAHEHHAGCLLLAKSLESALPNIKTQVVKHSWPPAEDFKNVDAVVIYSDGGGGHPAMKHLDELEKLTKQGVGLACIHYAVEVPKGPAGDHFVNWIGGYFETDWSVNPHWKAAFDELPEHPICNGVQPFEIQDEWYYHMRFRDEMRGIVPILTAVPPASTLSRPDGPHSGNPHVRATAGQPQHVAWVTQRDDGGRGFGFTGGHFHWNWADKNFRKVVLNAILWTAGGEVPPTGIAVDNLNLAALTENQDYPKPENFNPDQIRKQYGLDRN